MGAERLDMHRLQELVRLHRLGTGIRERSRLLGMSTRTERTYRVELARAGLLEGVVDALPALEVLRAAVEQAMPVATSRVVETSVDKHLAVLEAAASKALSPKAVWDKLCRDEPGFTGSYSAVKRAMRRFRKSQGVRAEDVVIPVDTVAGEVAQVDFTELGRLFDPETGKLRKAWIFLMVLGYSRHMYARAVFDQSTATWLALHMDAFRFFGGVPRVIVPDNLKAAVVRAAFGATDRHEIGLNRSYRELARHYGFKVDPTPVRSPKKKGKVESGAKYVVRNLCSVEDFETLNQANGALDRWTQTTAGKRVHGTTGRTPLEMFAEEKTSLLPLPAARYETIEWKQATVHPDSHVEFRRRLYSVPWRLVGRKVWIRATPSSVYVLADDARVATHERRGTTRRSTHDEHLPEFRRDLRHRSMSYWLERSDKLGEPVSDYIREVVESDDVLSKLRDVQAIVAYLEQFPPHRAHAACRRASFYGNLSFQGIKRILVAGLDLEPLPVVATVVHGALDQPRFARTVDELMASTLDVSHEPH
jgi:transposase